MSCNEEVTSIETVAPQIQGRIGGAGLGDETNLYEYIERDKVWGSGIEPPESAKNVIKPWNERESTTSWVESNVDDQLILNIPFTSPVRLRSILIKIGRGDVAPRRIKMFVNRPWGVDFSEATSGSVKASQEFQLLEGEAGVTEYPVRVAAFSNTSSVSLFFSDSSGELSSLLYYIGFKGVPLILKKDNSMQLDVGAETTAKSVVGSVKEERRAPWSGGVR